MSKNQKVIVIDYCSGDISIYSSIESAYFYIADHMAARGYTHKDFDIFQLGKKIKYFSDNVFVNRLAQAKLDRADWR